MISEEYLNGSNGAPENEQPSQPISNIIANLESLYASLRMGKEPPSKHPFYNKKADKTVTFLTANMGTSEGLYKNLIPAMAINQFCPNLRAFVANMQEVDARKMPSDYDYWISREMIEISDYIVLPFMTEDITDLVDSIRSVKKEIKVCYQVDDNIFGNNQTMHPTINLKKAIKTKSGREIIMNNCEQADMLLFSSDAVTNAYSDYLKDKKSKRNVLLKTFPLFAMEEVLGHQHKFFMQPKVISEFIRPREERFAELFPKPDNALRFGLFLSPENVYILEEFLPIMLRLNEKFSNRIQFVVVGATGNSSSVADLTALGKNADADNPTVQFLNEKIHPKLPKDMIYYYDRVPFNSYHSLPYILNLDAAVLFAKDNKFNQGHLNYAKFLEMCYMYLPVLASDVYPYNGIIQSGDNGILIANDPKFWTQEMENLLLLLDTRKDAQVYKLDGISQFANNQAKKFDVSVNYEYYNKCFA